MDAKRAQDQALAVARANVGPRYKPIELRRWDARDLPIDAGSVSAVALGSQGSGRPPSER